MTPSPTPFNDTCEPEDKAGWVRVQVRGFDWDGNEVVEDVWYRPSAESEREIVAIGTYWPDGFPVEQP